MLPMLFVKSEILKIQTISSLKQEIIEESVLQMAFWGELIKIQK